MIYDYDECQKIFDSFNNSLIKEIEPIGYTALEKLPIRCFTLGSGKNSVVVSASQHANETISTTFVIYLMKYLIDNNIVFDDLTIYFIPILNPEGYIVNTSAIRSKIGREESIDKITKYCYEYYKNYKLDDRVTLPLKLHQKMFQDVNYRAIDEKYSILRDSVGDILSRHPKGSIIDWASNGNGIDLNSNSINKQVSDNEFNRKKAYSNIRIDIPSPIGYPGNNVLNFEQELEILSLKKLFAKLNEEGNLIGFLNYHSTGGIIFQRPEDNNNLFSVAYNYLLSKFYQEYTIKNAGTYEIITNAANKVTSVNDTLRITYPGNLLIELSPMNGNPIGLFGDYTNYSNTIASNIRSFIYTMENIIKVYDTTKGLIENTPVNTEVYPLVDDTYNQMCKR